MGLCWGGHSLVSWHWDWEGPPEEVGPQEEGGPGCPGIIPPNVAGSVTVNEGEVVVGVETGGCMFIGMDKSKEENKPRSSKPVPSDAGVEVGTAD